MKIKFNKGDYFYLKERKKREVVKTLLFFGISVLLFLTGYIQTGTKANLLTIVAVLGCLPASKNAVLAIMFLKQKGCSEDIYNRIKNDYSDIPGVFNLYFTSYDKNFETSHLLAIGNTVIAFTENRKINEGAFEDHIKTVLSHDGLTGYNIKLYKDLDKYLLRIQQLFSLENEKGRPEDVLKTLFSVSL